MIKKNTNIIISIVSLSLVLFMPISCRQDDDFSSRKRGTQISFGTSTGYETGSATRTEYSGQDENGNEISSSSSWERIDWASGTDRIRILCEAAGNGPSADYVITGEATVSAQKSVASLAPCNPNGLQWGTGDHYFYAMYPAPGMSSNYAFTDNNPVSSSSASIAAITGNKAVLSGLIPANQEVILSGYEFKANMNYAYMYAATVVEEDDIENVSLNLKPIVTTFEFTLLTPQDDPITSKLISVNLSSTSSPLTGSFTATLSAGASPVIATSDVGNEITATIPGGGVTLSSTNAYKITLLALPEEQTNLTLKLNFEGGITRTLELKDNGSFIIVPACRKVYIRNLGVPGTVTEYFFGTLSPLTVGYAGGTGALSGAFESYRSSGTGSEALPFELQFSADNGLTWSATAPSWLSMDTGINYGGSVTGESISATIAPQVNTAIDLERAALVAATPPAEQPFDLSTINVATGDRVAMTTANCYVVQASGTYKFPVVYGNAVVKGEINIDSYKCRNGVNGEYRTTEDSRFIKQFRDHLDGMIESPYIEIQHSGKNFTAELIWTDVEGLVDNVSISGSGANAYISFNVPVENINQGNALIAVLADGVIAWSWHIWVTNEDMTAWQSINTNKFSPVSLGWCNPKQLEKYEEQSCLVRAVQSVTGNVSGPVTVTQSPEIIYSSGNNTNYQWGRKDPLQALLLTSSESGKQYYPTRNEYAPEVQTGNVHYGTTIRKPWISYEFHSSAAYFWIQRFDKAERGESGYQSRWGTIYHNAWNSAAAGTDDATNYSALTRQPVTKTVYDPCPVGFTVPNYSVFTPLSNTNFLDTTINGAPGRMYNNDFFLPLVPIRQTMIQIPAWPRYWAASLKDYRSPHACVFRAGLYNYGGTSNNTGFGYFCCPIKPLLDSNL